MKNDIDLFSILWVTALTVAQSFGAAEPDDVAAAKARQWKPISVGSFADSRNHAVMRYEEGKAPYQNYSAEQIVHIAENLLVWQNPDGGWPKNQDWSKVLSSDERAKLPGATGKASCGVSTFDNRTTWSHVDYLARVHEQTGLKRYADAAIRGIDYILAQQRGTGGWRGSDVDAITFNDDVMSGVLGTLKAIIEKKSRYAFVDPPLRVRVKAAYEEGVACILKCQIKVGDRLTAWCQQHDHTTFEPVWARHFEPPSIVTAESVKIVRFLMSIDKPDPEVVASIQAACAWFDKVKIEGLRVDDVKMEPVQFKFHWTDIDKVEVRDPKAPPIWARFYELQTEKPIFCLDRNILTDYADVGRERRTGYGWYGYWPSNMLEKVIVWRKQNTAD